MSETTAPCPNPAHRPPLAEPGLPCAWPDCPNGHRSNYVRRVGKTVLPPLAMRPGSMDPTVPSEYFMRVAVLNTTTGQQCWQWDSVDGDADDRVSAEAES